MCGRRLGGSVAVYRQLWLLQLGLAAPVRRSVALVDRVSQSSPVGRGGAAEVLKPTAPPAEPGCQIRPSSIALVHGSVAFFNPQITAELLFPALRAWRA